MVTVKPNANFYSLSGTAFPHNPSDEYCEYRHAWTEYPKQMKLRDFPMHLDIEATSRCNLRCTFCDKLPLLKPNQLGDMDFELYKRIIDEGSEHSLWGVKLSYRGEPLLHKEIVAMVDYAKQKGILDVYFNTNGMLLSTIMAEKLIEARLDRVSISVEGTNPDIFEHARVGAKFDVILRNIDQLINMRQRKGVEYPRVRVQSVRLPGLDVEQYIDYWKNRCDEVAMVDYKDEMAREAIICNDWACPQLWQRMTIEWDGTVFACNNDDMRKLSSGNVNSHRLYDCWHDLQIEKVRKLHQEGKSHQVPDCNGCPWRTAQISKLRK